MKEDNIIKLLPLLGSRFKKVRSHSWVVDSCPFAPWRHEGGVDRNPSFGISIGGVSSYHCWSCNSKGRLEDMVPTISLKLDRALRPSGMDLARAHQFILDEEDFLDIDEIQDWEERRRPRLDVEFPLWWLESFRRWRFSEEAVAYLKGRQGTIEIYDYLDMRFDFMRRRVCIPVRNWNGMLVGMHGRVTYTREEMEGMDEYIPYLMYTIKEGEKRISNPQCWLGEHLVDPERTVVMLEGYFDMISVMRVYGNVLCSLMAGLNDNKLTRVGRIGSIVTLYDPDEAGDKARERVDVVLGHDGRRIKHVMLPRRKSKEDRKWDAGSLNVKQVTKVLEPWVDLEYNPLLDGRPS